MNNRIKGLRKVKLGDIDAFKFGNPKARTERDEEILGKSMEQFGYVMPMLARGIGGRFELLDGHSRYERIVDGRPPELYANEKVDVIVVDVDDDNEARRIFLALQHRAAYDYNQLESFIEAMLKDGADTAEGIMSYSGLTADVVDALAVSGAEFLDDLAKEGETEETQETASRAGLTPEHVTFSVPLTREQNEIVHRAVNMAKKLYPDAKVTADALAMICSKFMEDRE